MADADPRDRVPHVANSAMGRATVGGIDVGVPSGGFLGGGAGENLSVTVFGEYAPSIASSSDSVRRAMFAR